MCLGGEECGGCVAWPAKGLETRRGCTILEGVVYVCERESEQWGNEVVGHEGAMS